jgi:colicin import membrane protein
VTAACNLGGTVGLTQLLQEQTAKSEELHSQLQASGKVIVAAATKLAQRACAETVRADAATERADAATQRADALQSENRVLQSDMEALKEKLVKSQRLQDVKDAKIMEVKVSSETLQAKFDTAVTEKAAAEAKAAAADAKLQASLVAQRAADCTIAKIKQKQRDAAGRVDKVLAEHMLRASIAVQVSDKLQKERTEETARARALQATVDALRIDLVAANKQLVSLQLENDALRACAEETSKLLQKKEKAAADIAVALQALLA